MKILYLLLFSLFISSCQEVHELKSYHDFTYEFRDFANESFSFEEISSIKPIDSKKIAIHSYRHLFESTFNFEDITSDSLIALKRFSYSTMYSNYDLFLIQVDSQNVLLIGNKLNKTLSSLWIPPNEKNEITIERRTYSEEPEMPIVMLTDIEENIKEGYSRTSKEVYEAIYEINKEGKLVFRERVLNKGYTFDLAPEKNPFSGFYRQKLDTTKVRLTVKDGSSPNHFSYRISIQHPNIYGLETFVVDNEKLDAENSVKFIHKERLIFRIYFENKSANLFWNSCDIPDDLPCSTIPLIKE